MLHLFALRLVCLQGVKHRNFNVIVTDDDAEEARLVLIEVRLVSFGSLHPFLVPALLLHEVHLAQPTVMLGFEVFGADVLCVMDVPSASVKQPDGVTPHIIILRLIMVSCSYLVGLPKPVKVVRMADKIRYGL